jgi:hypothetical protein
MASRSHTTFKKRQKEQARAERQRDKAAKRQQRKQEKRPDGSGPPIEANEPEDEQGLDHGDFDIKTPSSLGHLG